MSEVFQYLDPADYGEKERLDSLYQQFLAQGAPDGSILVKGVLQLTPDAPVVAATAMYAKVMEDYMGGGISWNSDKNPSSPDVRTFNPYMSWGVIESINDADYYHDRGVVYFTHRSPTLIHFPALYQLRPLNGKLEPAIKAHIAAEIVHVYLAIHVEISGQSLTDNQSKEFFRTRLINQLSQRFDKSRYYTIADEKTTPNGVSFQINLNDYLKFPLVNKLNIVA